MLDLSPVHIQMGCEGPFLHGLTNGCVVVFLFFPPQFSLHPQTRVQMVGRSVHRQNELHLPAPNAARVRDGPQPGVRKVEQNLPERAGQREAGVHRERRQQPYAKVAATRICNVWDVFKTKLICVFRCVFSCCLVASTVNRACTTASSV